MAGFKLAVGIGGAAVIIALLAPLAVFMGETVENPSLVSVTVEASGAGGVLTVSYNGSVPLTDFRVYAGSVEILVGTVTKGTKTVHLAPHQLAALEANGVTGIHYRIAGLYGVEQEKSG